MNRYPIVIYDDDENEIKLPTKMEVCGECRGKGVTVSHVEAEGGGFTGAEWEEMGSEFQRDYIEGLYDRTCESCKGQNVVEVADWDAMTPEHQKLFEEWCDDADSYAAEMAAERRAGC